MNSGIRGFPAGWEFGRTLRKILELAPGVILESEQDEQGLEVAAMTRNASPFVVSHREVTLCSPFPPHAPQLGTCGAHFVGLNAKHIPWMKDGLPATDHIARHWAECREEIRRRIAAIATS